MNLLLAGSISLDSTFKTMFFLFVHRATGSSERLACNKVANLAPNKSAMLLLNKLMRFVPMKNLRLINP
jgi:hypothetical protein